MPNKSLKLTANPLTLLGGSLAHSLALVAGV